MLGLLALLAIALGLLVSLLTVMLAWEMVHPSRRSAAWAMARGLPCDPGEMDLQYDEWWLEPAGSIRLPVWEIDTGTRSEVKVWESVGAKASNSLTAVFVHGWGHARVNSLQRIRPFLPLFDRIILYDLRGHGDSTGSCSTLGDGEDDDLLALLEHLGKGPFVLVGHSMGAVIALCAAAKASSQSIAGVIAYGPYCEFHRSLEGRLRVNGLPARPLSDLALLVQRARGLKPTSINPDALRSTHTPLLVIHGVDDQVSPLAHSRRIVGAMPDAVLVEVDEAAHTDAHSVDQAKHDDAVRGFVERVRT